MVLLYHNLIIKQTTNCTKVQDSGLDSKIGDFIAWFILFMLVWYVIHVGTKLVAGTIVAFEISLDPVL